MQNFHWLAIGILLLGLVLYFVTEKAKPREVGRLMFACGLLAALLRVWLGDGA